MECSGGDMYGGVEYRAACGGTSGTGCASGGGHAGFGTMTLVDYTCSPFHVHFHADFPGCNELEGIITDLYFDE